MLNIRNKIYHGFTLIEVLAAMSILVVLVLMMARIFSDSTKILKLGNRRADANMLGRAISDFIAKDLSEAVVDADNILRFHHKSEDFVTYTWTNDSISFVTFANDKISSNATDGLKRELVQVTYKVELFTDTNVVPKVDRYVLRRKINSHAITPTNTIYTYYNPSKNFWDARAETGNEIVLDNVASFDVWCYGAWTTNGRAYAASIPNFNSTQEIREEVTDIGRKSPKIRSELEHRKLPAFIDLMFTTLSSEDAQRAMAIENTDPDLSRKFVNDHGKRYTIRINLPNGVGYAANK